MLYKVALVGCSATAGKGRLLVCYSHACSIGGFIEIWTSCHMTVYLDSARTCTAMAWDPYNAWYGEFHILIKIRIKSWSELEGYLRATDARIATISSPTCNYVSLLYLQELSCLTYKTQAVGPRSTALLLRGARSLQLGSLRSQPKGRFAPS